MLDYSDSEIGSLAAGLVRATDGLWADMAGRTIRDDQAMMHADCADSQMCTLASG